MKRAVLYLRGSTIDQTTPNQERELRIDLFLHQQGLDTTTPAGKALFQMLGVFAEFERAMIQERVRAGLRRAVSEGKRLRRPPLKPALRERILEALNGKEGASHPPIQLIRFTPLPILV